VVRHAPTAVICVAWRRPRATIVVRFAQRSLATRGTALLPGLLSQPGRPRGMSNEDPHDCRHPSAHRCNTISPRTSRPPDAS